MGRDKRNSMDSIKLPDKDSINNLSGGYVNSRRVYKERGVDDFTNAVRADFDQAAPIKVPERTEAPEPKDEFDQLIEKEKAKNSGETKKKKIRGYKVGKKYIPAWLVRRIAIIVVSVLFVLITFFPPITMSTSDGYVSDAEIFGTQSISQVKESILANDYVYDIDNMSSENPNNYRVCTVDVDLKNFSPYPVKLPGFSIVKCDPMYKDKIISVRIAGGEVEMSPFSVKTVTVEVFLNVVDLTPEQFDDAMTSLVLRTNGLRKMIGPIAIPTMPGFVFVSDSLEYHLK